MKRKPIEAVSKPPEARAPRNDEKKLWLPLRPTVFEAARARQRLRGTGYTKMGGTRKLTDERTGVSVAGQLRVKYSRSS